MPLALHWPKCILAGVLEFFPAIDAAVSAVHSSDFDTAGIVKVLFPPPVGCNTVNLKVFFVLHWRFKNVTNLIRDIILIHGRI